MSDNIEKIFAGRMQQAELDRLIQSHEDYINGVKGGRRLILQFMNLSGLDFASHNLTDAVFTGSALIQCDLSGAKLERANLFGCDLRYANLEGAILVKADLRGVCARGARLNNADMLQADLREGQVLAYERSGELQSLYVDIPAPSGEGRTDFSKATMKRARLSETQAGRADFTEAEMNAVRMRNAHMRGANFEGANMENGDFTGADLTQVNLRDAIVMGAKLEGAKLEKANLGEALTDGGLKKLNTLEEGLDSLLKQHDLWVQTAGKQGKCLDLSGYNMRHAVNLRKVKLTNITARKAVFVSMNLSGIEIQHSMLDESDFRNAIMTNADFRGSSLRGAKFAKADLQGANFQALVLNDGRQTPVDLSGANLRYADLRNADFKYALLEGADLSFARVTGADFSHAKLDKIVTEGTDLKLAKGAEKVTGQA